MGRSEFLHKISANITAHGYHVTVVAGGALPRFAYTIGCWTIFGAELAFVGGEYYSQDEVGEIIATCVARAAQASSLHGLTVAVGSLGEFSLVQADTSWSKLLLLGVVDYYNHASVPAWQLVPDSRHRTLDVPDMSQVFEASFQPIWQWLIRKWDHPTPESAMALTNLPVLFGAKATEMVRWETDDWEIFSGAGPDVAPEDRRMVPLALLVGIDNSLEQAMYLPVGKGLWRDSEETEWHDWN